MKPEQSPQPHAVERTEKDKSQAVSHPRKRENPVLTKNKKIFIEQGCENKGLPKKSTALDICKKLRSKK